MFHLNLKSSRNRLLVANLKEIAKSHDLYTLGTNQGWIACWWFNQGGVVFDEWKRVRDLIRAVGAARHRELCA